MIKWLMDKSGWRLSVVILVIIAGCSSADKIELRTAETVFNKAMVLFDDEEYLEAKQLFDVIKLQYPASQYSDDAQYYLAECNYKREEYILSAFNFSLLRRVYPNSTYFKESLFKTGLCYYNLAPAYDRDQEYTVKAIKTMSEFYAVFPSDSLAKLTNTYIIELRNRMAQREFSIAALYRKLRSLHSSLIYYDVVIDEYDDTKFYEQAFVGKIEVLIEMKKWDKALSAIDLYYSIFKNGEFIDKVKSLEISVPKDY